MRFGHMTVDEFLSRYWQKQPVLFKQAYPGFNSWVSGDELAGMSLEPEVESRIVTCKGKKYTLSHGPFSEITYDKLGKKNWTLLVQGVDHWLPEVQELREHFSFIPNWRIDDVMVSFAAPGGGVGPHTDSYDVFLLQGEGTRIWELGSKQEPDPDLDPKAPLKIVRGFKPSVSYTLEPGDMLYVPPHWVHNGIAVTAGQTYSIGFRSPSAHDIGVAIAGKLLQSLSPETLYTDAGRKATREPGEISESDWQAMLTQFDIKAVLSEQPQPWLGEILTAPKPHVSFEQHRSSVAKIESALREKSTYLVRAGATKVAFASRSDLCWLFVNGQSQAFPLKELPWIKRLCKQTPIEATELPKGALTTVANLIKQGAFHLGS
jgi:50S ribosomal protein L16 3-hydroxylase